MKTYRVEFRVYASVDVDAESFDDAFEKAEEKFRQTEMSGGFEIVDAESYYAETDDGLTQKWVD